MTHPLTLLLPDNPSAVEANAAAAFAARWRGTRAATVIAGALDSNPRLAPALRAAGVEPVTKPEGFVLHVPEDGGPVLVCGADLRGVAYGLGKLLRLGADAPVTLREAPAVADRGVYFATHFNNWYEAAPIEEVEEYVRDLAMWGANALVAWFDMNWYPEDFDRRPDSPGMRMAERIRGLFGVARGLGMRVGLAGVANEGFDGQLPPELRADIAARKGGFYPNTQICPSKPGGLEMLLRNRRRVTEALGPVDVFWYWPYDQGGCGCPDCADESHEWAATFLRIGPQVTAAVRESSPNARVLLSTWLMSDRERALVYEACERGEDWFDGLLMETGRAGEPSVDARYTLSVFPEISMFDTYFTSYGCNGANPAPRRFVAEARRIAARGYGATLYSEGAYEDINKVVWLSTLWDPSRSAEDIAAEYAGYHLGDANRAAATDLVLGLEQTWGAAKLRTISTDETGRLLVLAESLDAALPDDAGARMRWRLLLHRARLDHLMARIGPDEELQQLVHRTVQDAAYGGDDEAQRETVRQLADRLAARVRGVNALFAAYEEYLTEYHLGRSTVLHFRPNDVIGGRDYAGLFAACEEALTAGDAADLHARLLSGYRRWLWQGGIDIDTFFL